MSYEQAVSPDSMIESHSPTNIETNLDENCNTQNYQRLVMTFFNEEYDHSEPTESSNY
jgi:hypothetical protein